MIFALLAACAPSATPTATLVATQDIAVAVNATLTALAPTNTPAPTSNTVTPTAVNATQDVVASATPIVVTLPAVTGEALPAPITLNVPAGWISASDVLIMNDVGDLRGVPFTVWQGPITGGKATITLFWGFRNVVNPFDNGAVDLWADGLRFLRSAIFEQGCNVGTDLKRNYLIGGLTALGTTFSGVKCPELPDARGWFAALQEQGLNFAFYAVLEGAPLLDNQNLDAYYQASAEVQAIFDSVTFNVPAVTPTPSS